jgi:hypothetical protein
VAPARTAPGWSNQAGRQALNLEVEVRFLVPDPPRASSSVGTSACLTPRQRLEDTVKAVSDLPFGGTDCALPMVYAQAKAKEIDTFVIYTDSETWAGDVHPAEALEDYRWASGIPARLVVVGMVSNGSRSPIRMIRECSTSSASTRRRRS